MNNPSDIEAIRQHPDFQRLVKQRRHQRIGLLSVVLSAVFFTYGAWAFAPGLISAPLFANGTVSVGIWLTLLIAVLSITLCGYYALIGADKLDRINQKILDDIQS